MSTKKSKNKLSLAWVEIDLKALRGNLRAIKKFVNNPSVGVLAVVKADAYGHGMPGVSRALWEEGVRFFGVANIEEAMELRQAFPQVRILVLGSFHPSQLPLYIRGKITPTLSSIEDAIILNRALKGKKTAAVHVKIDTGMGRLGLPYRETEDFFKKTKQLSHLVIEGVYTHFSSADSDDAKPTRRQLVLFSACLGKIKKLGLRPKFIHASNSAAIFHFKEAHFNLLRPGLALYGLKPSPHVRLPAGTRPVLSWKTRISFLKKFSKGQTVSYGRTHRILKNTLIAALPVGYSHGYRTAFSNRASVLVRGRLCPVVGRVTMDQLLVDVGQVPGVKRWEEAVLIGTQGRKTVAAGELAALAGTIPYEIVCAIHSRVPRIYKN